MAADLADLVSAVADRADPMATCRHISTTRFHFSYVALGARPNPAADRFFEAISEPGTDGLAVLLHDPDPAVAQHAGLALALIRASWPGLWNRLVSFRLEGPGERGPVARAGKTTAEFANDAKTAVAAALADLRARTGREWMPDELRNLTARELDRSTGSGPNPPGVDFALEAPRAANARAGVLTWDPGMVEQDRMAEAAGEEPLRIVGTPRLFLSYRWSQEVRTSPRDGSRWSPRSRTGIGKAPSRSSAGTSVRRSPGCATSRTSSASRSTTSPGGRSATRTVARAGERSLPGQRRFGSQMPPRPAATIRARCRTWRGSTRSAFGPCAVSAPPMRLSAV
jgi:hypothetical protein